MKPILLLALLAVAYATSTTEEPTTKETPKEDAAGNFTKMSRDAPHIIAYNQGALKAPFPAVARIRSKQKMSSIGAQEDVAITGLNVDMQKLLGMSENSNSRKGVFARKPIGIGSSYSMYETRPAFTGEPYLGGYNGIPETQDLMVSAPNYMGALTKPNVRKHTFGSYGSIDSIKGQSWRPQQQVNSEYGTYGTRSSEKANGYAFYGNGDYSNYETQQNPYGATYQGGADHSYGTVTQQNYGNTDPTIYGNQGSAGYSTGNSQWPTQTFSSVQPNWEKSQFGTGGNSYGQTINGFTGFKVEQMLPAESLYSNQKQTSGYGNQGYDYSNGDSADYGSDTSYTSSGYDNGNYPRNTNPMSSYKNSNYGTSFSNLPMSSVGINGDYGSTDYSSQYGNSGMYNYQVTKPSTSTSHLNSAMGSQYEYGSNYAPTDSVNYGSGNYQPSGYHTGIYQPNTQSSYASTDFNNYGGVQTNDEYRSVGSARLGYAGQMKLPTEFSMSYGYGANKGVSNVKITPKLTNNVAAALLIDDGYKKKSAL